MRSKYMHVRPIISYTDGVHIRYCDFMYTKFTYLQAPHTDVSKAYFKYIYTLSQIGVEMLSLSISIALALSISFSLPLFFHALVCFAISLRVFVVSSSFFHYMERLSDRANALTHARSSAQSPFRMSCLFFSCCFSFHVYEIENTYTSYYNIGQKGARVSLSSSFFFCVCLWEKLQARAKTQSKYLLYWSECVYRKVNYTYVATSYRIAIKCTLFRFNFDRKNCAPTREFRTEREKKKLYSPKGKRTEKKSVLKCWNTDKHWFYFHFVIKFTSCPITFINVQNGHGMTYLTSVLQINNPIF